MKIYRYENLIFDHRKVLGLLKELGMSQAQLAEAIGVCPSGLNQRLRGEMPFRSWEIYAISQELGIEGNEIVEYFFSRKE